MTAKRQDVLKVDADGEKSYSYTEFADGEAIKELEQKSELMEKAVEEVKGKSRQVQQLIHDLALDLLGLRAWLASSQACRAMSLNVKRRPELNAVNALRGSVARPLLFPSSWSKAYVLLCEHAATSGRLTARLELEGIEEQHICTYAKHPALEMSLSLSPGFGLLLDLHILTFDVPKAQGDLAPHMEYVEASELPPDWVEQAAMATDVKICIYRDEKILGRSQRHTMFHASWDDELLEVWEYLGGGLSWLQLACKDTYGFQFVERQFLPLSSWHGDLRMRFSVPASRVPDLLGLTPSSAPDADELAKLNIVGAFFDLPQTGTTVFWPRPYPQPTVKFVAELQAPKIIPAASAYLWRQAFKEMDLTPAIAKHTKQALLFESQLRFSKDKRYPKNQHTESEIMPEFIALWVLDGFGRTQWEAPCVKLRMCQFMDQCQSSCIRETCSGTFYPANQLRDGLQPIKLNAFCKMLIRYRARSRELMFAVMSLMSNDFFTDDWVFHWGGHRHLGGEQDRHDFVAWDSDIEEERRDARLHETEESDDDDGFG